MTCATTISGRDILLEKRERARGGVQAAVRCQRPVLPRRSTQERTGRRTLVYRFGRRVSGNKDESVRLLLVNHAPG